EKNEPRELTHGPWPRLRHLLWIHLIRWNGHLGKIVKQVVGKDLDRCHRQEGQPKACTEHTEHVPEIRAGAHANVFENVGENFATLDHTFLQHHEALFQEDHIGSFFGYIYGGIDG